MTSERRNFIKKMGLGLGLIGLSGPLFAKSEEFYQLSAEQQEFIEEYEASVKQLKTASDGIGVNSADEDSARMMMDASEKMAELHKKLEPHLENEMFRAYYLHTIHNLSKEIED